jgi:hypothetical protein
MDEWIWWYDIHLLLKIVVVINVIKMSFSIIFFPTNLGLHRVYILYILSQTQFIHYYFFLFIHSLLGSYSWGTHNLQDNRMGLSSSVSVSLQLINYGGLQLRCNGDCISTTVYSKVSFYVNTDASTTVSFRVSQNEKFSLNHLILLFFLRSMKKFCTIILSILSNIFIRVF